MAEIVPDISVIIPAYNEEKRLPATLDSILAYLGSSGYGYEVIVVDDGSNDNTTAIAWEAGRRDHRVTVIANTQAKGKGASVRVGMLKARGRYRFFSDADLSTPIEEMEALLGELKNGTEVAFGSRAISGSRVIVREVWYRDIMGKTFGFFVRSIALPGVMDSQCGFKGFTDKTASILFNLQRLNGFAFDVEVLFIARKFGLPMKEVPVRWIDSPRSKVNPIIDSFKMLVELFRIRLNDVGGKYKRRP
jgi:dolichyl-phosphate beta-glucosyltransferase